MPTSEPPWINQTSGVAARNGTTSHTISFGFTSTTGNFLVFVVHGAVTHAATGWTERLSPVGSGELSVFTKTSAGDSSITVTHNGSDFPVVWSAYEFASATTWVNGASNSQNSDAFPLLGSLPGTEVVVFGGRGRAAGTTAATSASSTVSAPWVEDADVFTADNGTTDGCYLHVIHQINVTATSITPTATPTYGGDWGAVPDRQHVSFALDVPASGSSAPINTALETDTAFSFGRVKTRALGMVTETSSVFSFARSKGIGTALEFDTALSFRGVANATSTPTVTGKARTDTVTARATSTPTVSDG